VPTGHYVWPAFVVQAGQTVKVRLVEERGDLRLIQTANPPAPALAAHRLLLSGPLAVISLVLSGRLVPYCPVPFRALATHLGWVLQCRALREDIRHCSKELNVAPWS
jgi:hypothetical protein